MEGSAKDGSFGSGMNKPRNNFLAQPKLLKASMLNNPFRKVESNESDVKEESKNLFASILSSSNTENQPDVNSSKTNVPSEKSSDDLIPKFVPLHSSKESVSFTGSTCKVAPQTEFSKANDFVFGQNLKDRIVNLPNDTGETSNSTDNDIELPSTNGTSTSLFSTVMQTSSDSSNNLKSDSGSLEESAQTWEKKRESSQLNLPPQQVLTGEEGEINKLQLNCRLFTFEGGSWKERGRGQLRLNDCQTSSRLVCRTAGSLRILLNTKIWGDMVVVRPGQKSLQITATDSQQQLKLFLIMANPDEIAVLHRALVQRVREAKKSESNQKDKSMCSVSDEKKSDNASSDKENGTECKESLKNNDDDKSESESSSNPVVVISNEDEDSSCNTQKRPQPQEEDSVPKKMCMALPSEEDSVPKKMCMALPSEDDAPL